MFGRPEHEESAFDLTAIDDEVAMKKGRIGGRILTCLPLHFGILVLNLHVFYSLFIQNPIQTR